MTTDFTNVFMPSHREVLIHSVLCAIFSAHYRCNQDRGISMRSADNAITNALYNLNYGMRYDSSYSIGFRNSLNTLNESGLCNVDLRFRNLEQDAGLAKITFNIRDMSSLFLFTYSGKYSSIRNSVVKNLKIPGDIKMSQENQEYIISKGAKETTVPSITIGDYICLKCNNSYMVYENHTLLDLKHASISFSRDALSEFIAFTHNNRSASRDTAWKMWVTNREFNVIYSLE